MSNKRFTRQEMDELASLSGVEKVTPRAVFFSPEFKRRAVKLHIAGRGASACFRELGFPLEKLGRERVESALNNWTRKWLRGESLKNSKPGRKRGREGDSARIRRILEENARLKKVIELLTESLKSKEGEKRTERAVRADRKD